MLHVQGDHSRFSSCLVSANLERRILDAYHEGRPRPPSGTGSAGPWRGSRGDSGSSLCSGISRAEPRVELARITEADAHGRPEVLERLQCYLLDAGAAWDDAEAGRWEDTA